MINFKKGIFSILMVIIGFSMVNCAGTPARTPVQETQHQLSKIEKDTLVANKAPLELQKAREAVSKVRSSVANSADQKTLKEQINLAKNRIQIAQKTAELRAAKEKVDDLSAELNELTNGINQIEEKRIQEERADMPIDQRVKYLENFNVTKTDRGLVLRFRGITFETGKAYLTSTAEGPINELADFLVNFPERSIRIEGYTDNTGSKTLNQQLSQDRASAVREALISRGISASRVQAAGLGEQYPLASNETEAGRKRNRRVEIVISDENGEFPHMRE